MACAATNGLVYVDEGVAGHLQCGGQGPRVVPVGLGLAAVVQVLQPQLQIASDPPEQHEAPSANAHPLA